MLIIDKDITSGTQLLVWKITEPLTFFLPVMPQAFFEETKNISNEKIKLQKALKYYLVHLKFPATDIVKDETGKPFLSNHKHISVSHSSVLACILLSENNCGVDIEKISPKVIKVKDKFLNHAEQQRFDENKELFTLLWSCKETLYKLYNISGIDFKNIFDIQSIDFDKKEVLAVVNQHKHTLYFEQIDDYFLTFTF